MKVMVSVDPGLRACGVAVWVDGRLVGAWLEKNAIKVARGGEAWRTMAGAVVRHSAILAIQTAAARSLDYSSAERTLVVERPLVYPKQLGNAARRGGMKQDPNDVVRLNGVVGALVGRVDDTWAVVTPMPYQWKGKKKKLKVIDPAKYVSLGLSRAEAEVTVWPAASLRHNVLDAILLGKWWLGPGQRYVDE